MTKVERLSRHSLWRAGWLAVLLCASVAVQAEPRIESVTGSVQGGAELVRIELSEPLAASPKGFAIQSPARIALDFPGVTNAMGRSAVEVNQGNLRSVNVVQAGDRTRVVLNLKQAAAYTTQIRGKTLLVLLEPAANAAAPAANAQQFAENRNRDVLPLRDLDFRRGIDNTGRVVVDLANNQVGVDIRQQGQTLVVEFLKTSLPEGLRRRLDVTDFGTPVQTVTTTQSGDRVRMVIEPRGLWEHSAYQSDNQFVVEVRPQKVDPSKLTRGPSYAGEKLSLNFQNIEVRSLLQVIADFTNFNIITSDSVTGAVTLRLKDVPWDQALDIILQAKGLGMRKTGNVLLVAPKDELNAKDKREFEERNALQNVEPLRTQGFQLNYTKAAAIAAQLGSSSGNAGGSTSRILSSRGSVISEPRTNQIFVTDNASVLQQVQDLISKLDIPHPAGVDRGANCRGFRHLWPFVGGASGRCGFACPTGRGWGFQVGNGNSRVAFGTSYANVVATSGAGGVVDSVNSNYVNLPSSGAGGFPAAAFAISIFNSAANRFLNLELSALEADGKGKVVSSPRVVTADQTKALIEQGTEFPFQIATASGATAVAFRKANLKLEVTPQITPEGNIILDLDVTKDTRGETTAQGIAINTKHVQTQVLVENGGTVVIGGIFELTENEDESRVPLLGDIPVLGNLFKTRNRTSNKQELLVFITPKMISDRSSVR